MSMPSLEFLAIGAARSPGALWSGHSIWTYGCHNSVAICLPDDPPHNRAVATLVGHQGVVTGVAGITVAGLDRALVSGGQDGLLCVWVPADWQAARLVGLPDPRGAWRLVATIRTASAVLALSCLDLGPSTGDEITTPPASLDPGAGPFAAHAAINREYAGPRDLLVAAAGADGELTLHEVHVPGFFSEASAMCREVAMPALGRGPAHSLAMSRLPTASSPGRGDILLAAGLSDATIGLWTICLPAFEAARVATIDGHTDWVGGLSFCHSPAVDTAGAPSLWLASASFDHSIRLWSVQLKSLSPEVGTSAGDGENVADSMETIQSRIRALMDKHETCAFDLPALVLSKADDGPGPGRATYSVAFEALLLGHEDPVHTVCWEPTGQTEDLAIGRPRGPLGAEAARPVPPARGLLTCSMDRTVRVWRGVSASAGRLADDLLWLEQACLGESGSTDHNRGFTAAAWLVGGPHAQAIAIGHNGNLRSWYRLAAEDLEAEGADPAHAGLLPECWASQPVCSGHTGPATDCAWDPHRSHGAGPGRYLLTAGEDHTARVFGRWRPDPDVPAATEPGHYYELCRPQLHGHPLAAIAFGQQAHTYACAAAGEKAARIMAAPPRLRASMSLITGHALMAPEDLAAVEFSAAADVQVEALGLSNRMTAASNRPADHVAESTADEDARAEWAIPPTEDCLILGTLWVEEHKLYGHPFELNTIASSADADLPDEDQAPGQPTPGLPALLATAAQASSGRDAGIRLWSMTSWRPIPLRYQATPGAVDVAGAVSLPVHGLTVTQMAFAPAGPAGSGAGPRLLLSVSRDRGIALHSLWPDEGPAGPGESVPDSEPAIRAVLEAHLPEAHRRMIWACAWLPLTAGPGSLPAGFVTASRDGVLRVFRLEDTGADSRAGPAARFLVHPTDQVKFAVSPLSALAVCPTPGPERRWRIALGHQSGRVALVHLQADSLRVVPDEPATLPGHLCPGDAVAKLAWRPPVPGSKGLGLPADELACVAADGSVRVFAF
ncbi:hypothetical protein H696_05215 [Fonticula alba]|uniref:Elongator complex protein 2 n=1 Tax=Fonticula alba TaxID=691883 RepID=A0A058Z2D2_FONAL|nr:hypothetical protein H696_05215 [Fonticula alba]KCV68296.1 hypothetical protein H696_05215 [Fonticula alba]|eukprot:XP_009497350.1 hypothetical protein H696_05215 [Fonticula alba]